jgi:hypothetical protein
MVATFREGGLVAWAEASGQRRTNGRAGSGLRFAFYGRVSTEDWQREGPPHHARCLRVGFGAAGFAGACAGALAPRLGDYCDARRERRLRPRPRHIGALVAAPSGCASTLLRPPIRMAEA